MLLHTIAQRFTKDTLPLLPVIGRKVPIQYIDLNWR